MTFRPCFGHYQVKLKYNGRYIYIDMHVRSIKNFKNVLKSKKKFFKKLVGVNKQ